MVHRNRIASIVAIVGTLITGTAAARTLVITEHPSARSARSVNSPTAPTAAPVTIYQDQYIDDPVDDTSPIVPAPATSPVGAGSPQLVGSPATPPPTGRDTAPSGSAATVAAVVSNTSDASNDVGDERPTSTEPSRPQRTTTSPPRTTSTIAPTAPSTTVVQPSPTTTWPPGVELPSDWPAGKPYPPIPPGCRQPHLEDNGVWNCEH